MIAEELQDQAALYVLGALDSSEAAQFEGQANANAELQELVRQLRDSASALAYAAPAKTAPAELRSRILDQISSETKVAPFPQERRSVMSWLPWAIAAALAIYCGVLAVDRSRMRESVSTSQQKIETTARELVTTRQNLGAAQQGLVTTKQDLANAQQSLAAGQSDLANTKEALAATQKNLAPTKEDLATARSAGSLAEATIVSLAGTPNAKGSSAGSIVWRQDSQTGLIKLSDMPALGPGKDYQLWVIDADYKDPISAGVVEVSAKGVAELRFKPTRLTNHPKAFAISVERKGGADKKEGPIVLMGTVNA
jgi:anti-sigma-K factor RskA